MNVKLIAFVVVTVAVLGVCVAIVEGSEDDSSEQSLSFSVDGFTFIQTGSDTNKVKVSGYNNSSDVVEIPSTVMNNNIMYTVVSVGDSAFENNSSMTALTIPDTVSSIGKHSFKDCSRLSMVVLPITLNTVPDNGCPAFEGCSNIDKITFVAGDGSSCDYDDNKNTPWMISNETIRTLVLSEGVKKIGKNMFRNCTGISSVILPDSIQEIGVNAFEGCENLKELSIPASVKVVSNDGNPVFAGCNNITKITLTAGMGNCLDYEGNNHAPWRISSSFKTLVVSAGINTIGKNMFKGCEALENISMARDVVEIKEGAFSNCTGLVSIDLNEVRVLGDYAFKDCTYLTTFTGNVLKTLGKETFGGCTQLKEAIIPDHFGSFGECSFKNCTALGSLTLPISVNVCNGTPFKGCNAIKTFTFTAGSGISVDYDVNSATPWRHSEVALMDIIISEGVKEIGNNMFKGCSNIETVKVPETVYTIKNGAFSGCSALKDIILPESLVYMGSSVFEGCTSLISVTIPASLPNLGPHSFRNCVSIKEITIPTSTSAIGDLESPAFSGVNIEKVTFVKGIQYQTTYVEESETPWRISNAFTTAVISEGVTQIPQYLFYGCTNLSSITLPSTLTSISAFSFNGCTALNEIDIPDSVTKVDDHAFANCSGLKSVQFGIGLTVLGTSSFSGCSSIAEINLPRYLKSIQKEAFADCTSLTYLIIPGNVNYLGSAAFKGCVGIEQISVPVTLNATGAGPQPSFIGLNVKKVILTRGSGEVHAYKAGSASPWYISKAFETLEISKGVTEIAQYTFWGCENLNSISFPSTLKTIGKCAFTNCQSLENLTLPDSHVELKEHSFSKCIKLTSIDFGKTETVGEEAFIGCSSIKELVIPDTIRTIKQGAFSEMTSLETLTISDGVSSLGNYAFRDCENMKSLTIPISVNSVVKNKTPAFAGCKGIETITFTKGDGIGHDYGDNVHTPWNISKNSIKKVVFSEGIRIIGERMFSGCSFLTSITIPGTVTDIKARAFENCTGLTSIDFGKTETVGEEAFLGCSSIKKLVTPDTLKTIDQKAFSKMISLESLTISGDLSSLGNYAFRDCENMKSLTIPISVNSVVNNKAPAFEGCKGIEIITFIKGGGIGHDYDDNTHAPWNISKNSIKKVVFSEGIQIIGERMFSGCSFLTSITIPGTVTDIKARAFENCTGLTAIDLGNVRVLGEKSLKGCSSIKGITLPETMTSIDNEAMSGLTSLKSLIIPDNVKALGENSFKGCTGLTDLTIPISLNAVVRGDNPAFNGCKSIANVTLTAGSGDGYGYKDYKKTPWCISKSSFTTLTVKEGVKTIGDNAFRDCHNLSFVDFPNTLTRIKADAFHGCNDIAELHLPDSLQIIEKCAFQDCVGLNSITFGEGLVSISVDSFKGLTFFDSDGITLLPASAENMRGSTFYMKILTIQDVEVVAWWRI